MKARNILIALLLMPALWSCGQRTPTIDFGKAECAHCRMNVVDRQFGAALVTEKGRQYVFDDVSCMVRFVLNGSVAEDQVKAWYVCDHDRPGTLIDATTARYLHGPAFRSPMRGDIAAFSDESARSAVAPEEGSTTMDWTMTRQRLSE
ncbi:MAG: nitrous oxide reductase accessory protein NosL [Flavobacteriales bacterium]|nr:nitrous oxide reductase accessory protein NosL [Flavobacteriales bacterium]